MTENQKIKIMYSMIDAAGIARLGGDRTGNMGVEILETLAPLMDGWLPERVIRDENGKIVVLAR